MPVDLPVRKTISANANDGPDWLGVVVVALCLAVILAELVSLTPKTSRAGLSVTAYEAMMQSP